MRSTRRCGRSKTRWSGADIFFGLSAKGALTSAMVKSMAPNPIIFAMANPDPEITPEDAQKVRDDVIVATGRSDYPNQVNNVLGFPVYFPRRARRAREHDQHGDEDRGHPGARRPRPRGRARRGGGRLSWRAAALRTRLHHSGSVRSSAHLTSFRSRSRRRRWTSGVARRPIVDLAAYKAQLSARRDPIAGVMQRIIERVRRMPKRVVFAEGEEEQVHPRGAGFRQPGTGHRDSGGTGRAGARRRHRGSASIWPTRGSRFTTRGFRIATRSMRSFSTSGCNAKATCCATASA